MRAANYTVIHTEDGSALLLDLATVISMHRCGEPTCQAVHIDFVIGSIVVMPDEAARVRGLLTGSDGPVPCDDLLNAHKVTPKEGRPQ